MFTRRRRPPLDFVNICEVPGERKDLHNGEDLEEIVLGEILMRVMFVQLQHRS